MRIIIDNDQVTFSSEGKEMVFGITEPLISDAIRALSGLRSRSCSLIECELMDEPY